MNANGKDWGIGSDYVRTCEARAGRLNTDFEKEAMRLLERHLSLHRKSGTVIDAVSAGDDEYQGMFEEDVICTALKTCEKLRGEKVISLGMAREELEVRRRAEEGRMKMLRLELLTLQDMKAKLQRASDAYRNLQEQDDRMKTARTTFRADKKEAACKERMDAIRAWNALRETRRRIRIDAAEHRRKSLSSRFDILMLNKELKKEQIRLQVMKVKRSILLLEKEDNTEREADGKVKEK